MAQLVALWGQGRLMRRVQGLCHKSIPRIDLQKNLSWRGVSCAIYLSAGSEANDTDSSYF